MKTIIGFILFFFLVCTGVSNAQTDISSSKIEAGWGSLNYAVPESPAFKILGVSDNNIMRPTSTRDIGMSIGNYYVNNGATIPKNFSVEIAPSLFNPKVSLTEFQNSATRLWYTSTFSLGTKINKDGSYDIGIGLKGKLIDDADLRSNGGFKSFADSIGVVINRAYSEALEEEIRSLLKKDTILNYDKARLIVTGAYNKKDGPYYSNVNNRIDSITGRALSKIPARRNSEKELLWNARVWDVGIAALLSSKDSLIKHLSAPSKVGIWSTYGCPLGSSVQLLIGMNAQALDDSLGQLNQWGGNLGLRGYYGSNDTKGFLQAESSFLHAQLPTHQVGIGIETTFAGCIWIDFSIGMKKTGTQPFVFTPGLNISYATEEKK